MFWGTRKQRTCCSLISQPVNSPASGREFKVFRDSDIVLVLGLKDLSPPPCEAEETTDLPSRIFGVKRMMALLAIRMFVLWLCIGGQAAAGEGHSTAATCPALCRCDEDGGADCSGRGLTAVPAGLSAFTYYL